jgi:NAD(P)-dependent dehydrogenase (short-subunit alcohol dehydrogenase family)/acyl carrier protein
MLDIDTNLEADLGIDSIKRVEIIGTFRRSVLPDLLEPPAWFMERMGAATTLRQCLDGVRELLERQGASGMRATTSSGTAAPSRIVPPPATSAADLEERLANIIAERTGYPTDMLDPDADLEADLGIDSIKRVEIIGAFRRSIFPSMVEPPVWFMERMTSAATLRAICDGVAELLSREASRSIERPIPVVPVDAAPPARATTSDPARAGAVEPPTGGNGHDPALESCPRCVARAMPCPLPESASVAVPAGVVLITDDGEGAAGELARAIESAGGRAVVLDVSDLGDRAATAALVDAIRREHGPIGAVAHLGPSRSAPEFPGLSAAAWASHLDMDLKSLLFLLQAVAPELGAAGDDPIAVLAVTRGAGDFGAAGEAVHPWRGGIAGLLKTAAREWTHARIRAIDLDDVPAPALLLRELSALGPVEIGYRGGERWTVVASEEDVPAPAGAAPLDERDVVLVTGGARGITAQITREIALRARPAMILLGRSPRAAHPEDEETAGIDDPIALRQAIIAAKRRQGEAISPREVEARLGELLRNREIEETLARIPPVRRP